MHPEANHFMLYVKLNFPEFFINKLVLDVGGGDINGNNRYLFNNCDVHVNDVCSSPNVTIVSRTKDLLFSENTFDTIVSTECFEHDPEYKESFLKIFNMLKPGGLFAFTCASIGREEHGTRRTSPEHSFGTISNQEDMIDYYKNLSHEDILEIIDLDLVCSYYNFYYNSSTKDLYFFGIKMNSHNITYDINEYCYPNVRLTKTKTNMQLNHMEEVFKKYNTDKNIEFHNYSRQYNSLLSKKQLCNVNLMEIGVFGGESLKAWKEYFINANKIVGLDINIECKKYEDITKNIYVEIMGIPHDVSMIKTKYNLFDIIIDDGSHHINDVISNFNDYFNLLTDGGIYIVEDTVCYKSGGYLNTDNSVNHLSYFSNFIQYLNQWRFDSTSGTKDNCVDPFKICKNTSNMFEASIDKIEFGISYIAIHKKIRYHWL
jgi:hypothetical protein